jgi:hypothetical protein
LKVDLSAIFDVLCEVALGGDGEGLATAVSTMLVYLCFSTLLISYDEKYVTCEERRRRGWNRLSRKVVGIRWA